MNKQWTLTLSVWIVNIQEEGRGQRMEGSGQEMFGVREKWTNKCEYNAKLERSYNFTLRIFQLLYDGYFIF